MSKGSTRRPAQVSAQTYRDNHDRIFGKKDGEPWKCSEPDCFTNRIGVNPLASCFGYHYGGFGLVTGITAETDEEYTRRIRATYGCRSG